jgi:ATP-dependent DNA helicase RecG
MSKERVVQLLKEREGIRLEFKKATNALPANLFDSICAMLNREGGDILLGVGDDGTLLGIPDDDVAKIMAEVSNLSNNAQKLNPPFILHPSCYKIQQKNVIHIQVPASSQIHETAGVVYDRSNEGDFKAKQPHQIAALHNHKRNFYSESIIYPRLQISDFNPSLFPKLRQLIRSNKPTHPWLALEDEQLLKTAGLWRRDYDSGEEGYTLAAVLLLGKDEVIQQILPHYKIDAIVRIENVDRYDDRLYIQTNLVDAYDLLMAFVEKHLPDKFYLHGDIRISLRSQIFREVIANLIVHREYTNAHPCTLVILKDKVVCENANNPHGEGPINPKHFAPFPKNPALAKFFLQLGRVDELGSGVLNVFRLVKEYAGKVQPHFIEGSIFSTEVPLPPRLLDEGLNEGLSEGLSEGLNEGLLEEARNQLNENLFLLLEAISKNPGSQGKQLSSILNNRPIKTIERHIKELTQKGLIERIGSKRTGGYFLIKKK